MNENITKQLTDKLIQSIRSFFSNRISKEEITRFKEENHTLYFAWYFEWIKHISTTKHLLWLEIRKQKNNLVFINSIFDQFDYLLQSVQQFEKKCEPSTVQLNTYFDYANDVHIEAFGKTLPMKDYKKSELLVIIKKCEQILQEQFINQIKPTHNVRTIRV